MAIITKFLGGVLVFGALATNQAANANEGVQLKTEKSTSEVFYAPGNKPFAEMLQKVWQTDIDRFPGRAYVFIFTEIKIGEDRYVLSQIQNPDCRPDECDWLVIKADSKYDVLAIGKRVTSCGGTVPVIYKNDQFIVCNKAVPLP